MKLILAVSADGYLCKGSDDDMSWTGPVDKAIFKLLTMDGGCLWAGSKTYNILPHLPDRKVHNLRQESYTRILADRKMYVNDWLIGGPTLALEALIDGLINTAYICQNNVSLGGGVDAAPIMRYVNDCLKKTTINFDDVTVKIFSGIQ